MEEAKGLATLSESLKALTRFYIDEDCTPHGHRRTGGMEAHLVQEASVAQSKFTQQVAKLRTFLVVAYVSISLLSLTAGFVLSWNSLPGAPWFLATATAFGFWASVTATCSRISAGDFLGVAKIVKFKDRIDSQEAA